MTSLDGGMQIVERALDALEFALKVAQACGWSDAITVNRRLDSLRQGWWKVAGSPKPQKSEQNSADVGDEQRADDPPSERAHGFH